MLQAEVHTADLILVRVDVERQDRPHPGIETRLIDDRIPRHINNARLDQRACGDAHQTGREAFDLLAFPRAGLLALVAKRAFQSERAAVRPEVVGERLAFLGVYRSLHDVLNAGLNTWRETRHHVVAWLLVGTVTLLRLRRLEHVDVLQPHRACDDVASLFCDADRVAAHDGGKPLVRHARVHHRHVLIAPVVSRDKSVRVMAAGWTRRVRSAVLSPFADAPSRSPTPWHLF